jgi:hypothetical protein
MTSELALLEASLADSQRQAMSLGSRLALAETKNDELLSQSQVGHGCSRQLSTWVVNHWLFICYLCKRLSDKDYRAERAERAESHWVQ